MLNDSKIAQLNSERPLHQTAVGLLYQILQGNVGRRKIFGPWKIIWDGNYLVVRAEEERKRKRRKVVGRTHTQTNRQSEECVRILDSEFAMYD